MSSGGNQGKGGSGTTVVDRDRLDPRLTYLLGPRSEAPPKPARPAKLPKARVVNARRPIAARAQAAVGDRVKPLVDRVSAAGKALHRIKERKQARAWRPRPRRQIQEMQSEGGLWVLIVLGVVLALVLCLAWNQFLGIDDPLLDGGAGLIVTVMLGLVTLVVMLGLLVAALAGAGRLWEIWRWRARPRKRPTRSE